MWIVLFVLTAFFVLVGLVVVVHGFVELVFWDHPDPESAFQRRRKCTICRLVVKVCLRP